MALTAPFPSITIVGNAANQVFPTDDFLAEVYEVKNGYTTLFYERYGTEFPFWDETAMFSVLDPSNVLNSTTCELFFSLMSVWKCLADSVYFVQFTWTLTPPMLRRTMETSLATKKP